MKGATPVILIALSIGLFVYYIRPQYEQIETLQERQEQYDDALAAADELFKLRDELVNKYNSFSTADLRRLQKFLPKQIDDVRLLLDIDQIAEGYDITLEEIEITDVGDENKNTAKGAVRQSDEDDIDLNTLGLSFTFDATYDEFVDFFKDLESSLRIIDITELSFRSVGSGENNAYSNVYTFSVALQTYWLK